MLALGGGLVAVATIAVLALTLGGGGGDGEPSAAQSGDTSKAKKEKSGGEGSANRQAATLTKSQLIEKADRICSDSKETYKGVFSRASEESPDIAYSQVLLGISTRATGRLEALDPPAGIAEEYGKYVRAQERVRGYDRQALEAAKAEDAGAYDEARERRDAEQAERELLAGKIGFEVCSVSGG